jgi:hypothetical protein
MDKPVESRSKKRTYVGIVIAVVLLVGAGTAVLASVPHAFVTNETLTAANLNANFTALDTRLSAVETAQPGKSAFQVHQLLTQNFTPGVGSGVLFDQTDFDLGKEFTTNSGKFTSTTGGIYDVTCTLEWNAGPAAGASVYYQTELWINMNTASGVQGTLTTSGSWPTVTAHGLVRLAAGDTLLCQGYQASPTTLTLQNDAVSATRFSAFRVSL